MTIDRSSSDDEREDFGVRSSLRTDVALRCRAIMADLRAGGDVIGGPAPFAKTDRSRFLNALDAALVKLRRIAETSSRQ